METILTTLIATLAQNRQAPFQTSKEETSPVGVLINVHGGIIWGADFIFPVFHKVKLPN